jgi:hypothetical protein
MNRISISVLPLLLLAAMSAASAAQSSGARAPHQHQMLHGSNRPPGLIALEEPPPGEPLDKWEIPLDPQQIRNLAQLGASPRPASKAAPAAAGKVPVPPVVAKAPATGAAVATSFANVEALLRKQLLDDYDKMSFPWAEYGTANVSVSVVFHRVLDVNLYAGG